MKRTFTVTAEADFNDDNSRQSDEFFDGVMAGNIPAVVTVTETTAVHAKEREVIAAVDRMAMECGSVVRDLTAIQRCRDDVVKLNRELRALMEGKA